MQVYYASIRCEHKGQGCTAVCVCVCQNPISESLAWILLTIYGCSQKRF